MSKIRVVLLCGVLSTVSFFSFKTQASEFQLFDFVAFSSESITAECSDFLGRVASGGDAHFKDFLIEAPSIEGCALYSRGDVHYTRGSLRAQTISGSVLSCANSKKFYPNSSAYRNQPRVPGRDLSFDSLEAEMIQLSRWLSLEAPLQFGSKKILADGVVESQSPVNVFEIQAHELTNLRNLIFKSNDLSSVFIINIRGVNSQMMNLGVKVIGKVGLNKILMNFTDSTHVKIKNSGAHDSVFGKRVGLPFTILAPYAVVEFNDALITGALFSRIIKGHSTLSMGCASEKSGQINPSCFIGNSSLEIGCGYEWSQKPEKPEVPEVEKGKSASK